MKQQIYDQLPNFTELEDCANELDALPSISDMGDDDSYFVKRCATALADCLDKFHAIKEIANSFKTDDDEEPLGEWSDDALHDELFNLKESIVNHDEIESVKLLLLVTDLCKAKAIQTELESRAEECLRGGGE